MSVEAGVVGVGRESARAPQVGLPMRRFAGSDGVTGRKAWRSLHSSAVKRHSLLGVAHHLGLLVVVRKGEGGTNQQVAVFGVTGVSGSLRGALARGPVGAVVWAAAVVACWAARI